MKIINFFTNYKESVGYSTLIVLYVAVIGTLLTSQFKAFPLRSFTVLTGSMEPKINVGSVVYAFKSQNYQKGDVITFTRGDITVTHRIYNFFHKGNVLLYQTKGDANNAPDQELVSKSQVIGKVFFFLPYVGRVINFIKTIPGFLLFIVLPTSIFISFEVVTIKKELEKEIKKKLLQQMEARPSVSS